MAGLPLRARGDARFGVTALVVSGAGGQWRRPWTYSKWKRFHGNFIIWVFPKIVVPPNHPIVNRGFHYFHHPFWGVYHPYFWFNTHIIPETNSKRTWKWRPWKTSRGLQSRFMWMWTCGVRNLRNGRKLGKIDFSEYMKDDKTEA